MRCMYTDEKTGFEYHRQSYPEQDFCSQHLNGCAWEIRKAVENLSDPRKSRAAELCGRLPERGSEFCPKHALMTREASAEMERKMARVRAHKERKVAERLYLPNSPLRANAGWDDPS